MAEAVLPENNINLRVAFLHQFPPNGQAALIGAFPPNFDAKIEGYQHMQILRSQ